MLPKVTLILIKNHILLKKIKYQNVQVQIEYFMASYEIELLTKTLGTVFLGHPVCMEYSIVIDSVCGIN